MTARQGKRPTAVQIGCDVYGLSLFGEYNRVTNEVVAGITIGEQTVRLKPDEARDVAERLLRLLESALKMGDRQ